MEGAPSTRRGACVEKVSGDDAVLCTHGDIMGGLLMYAERQGIAVDDRIEKGATWVLDVEAGTLVAARYVPPGA